MKEMLRYVLMKLKQEKGEVSVEWALVAVIMAIIIAGVFMPGVQGGIQTAIDKIKSTLTTAAQ